MTTLLVEACHMVGEVGEVKRLVAGFGCLVIGRPRAIQERHLVHDAYTPKAGFTKLLHFL